MLQPKLRTGLLSLAALLLVAGCGKQAPVPEPEPDPEPEPAPEIVVGSPGPVGDMVAMTVCEAGSPTIELSWPEVDKAESYLLERNYAVIAEFTEPTTVSYVDADVEAGNDYTYRLTAVNEYGEAGSAPVEVGLAYSMCSTLVGDRLVAGDYISYLIDDDGSLWAWGDNSFGQVGTGIMSTAEPPVKALFLDEVVSVAAEWSHTLVLDSDGTVWGLGFNEFGQLGPDLSTESYPIAVPVAEVPMAKAVAVGERISLALAEDGTVFAWGRGEYGELGLGDSITTGGVPTQIDGLEDVVAIHVASFSSFAVHEDGTVSAWGYNHRGQLGLGDEADRSVPETIPGLTGITQVAGNETFTLMLDGEGSVWAMGNGDLMANGTLDDESSPRRIEGLTGIVDIAAGRFYALAVRDDGQVFGWGQNYGRELGGLEDTMVPEPTALAGLDDVVQVAAGNRHGLALSRDGGIRSWGDNLVLQLGDGDEFDRAVSNRWTWTVRSCRWLQRGMCWRSWKTARSGPGAAAVPVNLALVSSLISWARPCRWNSRVAMSTS